MAARFRKLIRIFLTLSTVATTGMASASASLSVKKLGFEKGNREKEEHRYRATRSETATLRYEAQIRGDAGDRELVLEVYHYGRNYGKGSQNHVPMTCVARDRIFVPVSAKDKTIVTFTSPVAKFTERTHRNEKKKLSGVKFQGVFCRLLRGSEVIKTFKDAPGLQPRKESEFVPEVDATAEFEKPAAHEIETPWLKAGEELPKAAKETPKFMSVGMGDEMSGGTFDPPKKFRNFTRYDKYVTPKTHRLYALKLTSWQSGPAASAEEFKSVVATLAKKYGVEPVVGVKKSQDREKLPEGERTFRVTAAKQQATLELSGMTIRVYDCEGTVVITVESPEHLNAANAEYKVRRAQRKPDSVDRDIDVL